MNFDNLVMLVTTRSSWTLGDWEDYSVSVVAYPRDTLAKVQEEQPQLFESNQVESTRWTHEVCDFDPLFYAENSDAYGDGVNEYITDAEFEQVDKINTDLDKGLEIITKVYYNQVEVV
mgnify:CR=1 FL=1